MSWAPNPPPRVTGFGPLSVTLAVLIVAVHAYLSQMLTRPELFEAQLAYGFITTGGLFASPDGLTGPWIVTFWTSSLLHGDWTHVIMNAVFLVALGSIHEKRRGLFRFVLLLVLAAPISCLFELAIPGAEPKLVVGASGVGFALLGAILTMRQGGIGRSTIGVFVLIGVTALAGEWGLFGFKLAWLAHLGGYLFGVLFALLDMRFSAPPAGAPPSQAPPSPPP